MVIKIKLTCQSCGAPITHILPEFDDDYGHIYMCDYCGTRYYIRDDTLQKYYEPELESETKSNAYNYDIDSSSTTDWDGRYDITKLIIYIAVAMFMFVFLFPIALKQIQNIAFLPLNNCNISNSNSTISTTTSIHNINSTITTTITGFICNTSNPTFTSQVIPLYIWIIFGIIFVLGITKIIGRAY